MPVQVINDSFLVCSDCILPIANGDFSGLDYHYDGEESAKRYREIADGMKNAGGELAIYDDPETGGPETVDFSRQPCACCGSTLAGKRHRCVVLGYYREAES